MQVGLIPSGETFDFRYPSLIREFALAENTVLVMEWCLLVKGVTSTGFFAIFLKLNPGFDIYVGNIKVFNFVQHGINDEVGNRGCSVHRGLSGVSLSFVLLEVAQVQADNEQDGGAATREGVRPGQHPHHCQGHRRTLLKAPLTPVFRAGKATARELLCWTTSTSPK